MGAPVRVRTGQREGGGAAAGKFFAFPGGGGGCGQSGGTKMILTLTRRVGSGRRRRRGRRRGGGGRWRAGDEAPAAGQRPARRVGPLGNGCGGGRGGRGRRVAQRGRPPRVRRRARAEARQRGAEGGRRRMSCARGSARGAGRHTPRRGGAPRGRVKRRLPRGGARRDRGGSRPRIDSRFKLSARVAVGRSPCPLYFVIVLSICPGCSTIVFQMADDDFVDHVAGQRSHPHRCGGSAAPPPRLVWLLPFNGRPLPLCTPPSPFPPAPGATASAYPSWGGPSSRLQLWRRARPFRPRPPRPRPRT